MRCVESRHFAMLGVLITLISIVTALSTPNVTSTRQPGLGHSTSKNDTNIQERGGTSSEPPFATFGSDDEKGTTSRNSGDIGNRSSEHGGRTSNGTTRHALSDTDSGLGGRADNASRVNGHTTSRNTTDELAVRNGTGATSVHRDQDTRPGKHGSTESGGRGGASGFGNARNQTNHGGLGSDLGHGGTTGLGGARDEAVGTEERGLPGTLGGHVGRPDILGSSHRGNDSEHRPLTGTFGSSSSKEDTNEHAQPGVLGDHDQREYGAGSAAGGSGQTEGREGTGTPSTLGSSEGHHGGRGVDREVPSSHTGRGTVSHGGHGTSVGSGILGNTPGSFSGEHTTDSSGTLGSHGSVDNSGHDRQSEGETFGDHGVGARGSSDAHGNGHGIEGIAGPHEAGEPDGFGSGSDSKRDAGLGSTYGGRSSTSSGRDHTGTTAGQNDSTDSRGTSGARSGTDRGNHQPTLNGSDRYNSTADRTDGGGHRSGNGLTGRTEGSIGSGAHGLESDLTRDVSQRRGQENTTQSNGRESGSTISFGGGLERPNSGR